MCILYLNVWLLNMADRQHLFFVFFGLGRHPNSSWHPRSFLLLLQKPLIIRARIIIIVVSTTPISVAPASVTQLGNCCQSWTVAFVAPVSIWFGSSCCLFVVGDVCRPSAWIVIINGMIKLDRLESLLPYIFGSKFCELWIVKFISPPHAAAPPPCPFFFALFFWVRFHFHTYLNGDDHHRRPLQSFFPFQSSKAVGWMSCTHEQGLLCIGIRLLDQNEQGGSLAVQGYVAPLVRIKPWQSLLCFPIVQRATNMRHQVARMNHDWCATKRPEWTMTGAQPSAQNEPWLVCNQVARMNHDWCTTKRPEWTSTLTSALWRMDGKWSWNRSLRTNHDSVP